jgi:hypothetical protein
MEQTPLGIKAHNLSVRSKEIARVSQCACGRGHCSEGSARREARRGLKLQGRAASLAKSKSTTVLQLSYAMTSQ